MIVRAAGGVVERDGRVLVVHRPRYDDWTFPKGKVEEGESDEECALREVREETGLVCALERELRATEYGSKLVRWWRMRPLDDTEFAPNEEVDEIRWLEPAEAAALLTYPGDRGLLD